MPNGTKSQKPTWYEIRVSGRLDPQWSEWFGNLSLAVEQTTGASTFTILSGPVADQAALFGVLNRIRDLGLRLISVNTVPGEGTNGTRQARLQEAEK
jgi:hypothetical protein